MDDFQSEIDADSGTIVLREELVDVAFDDGRLARSQLADDQHFVQMFVFRVSIGVDTGLQYNQSLKKTRNENRKNELNVIIKS